MKYKCEKCKECEEFEVYYDVYCKDIISYPHFEIVCKNCKYGFVVKR